MSEQFHTPLAGFHATLLMLFFSTFQIVNAQNSPQTADDGTVVYPAAYFSQYELFSVGDMLQRIPGINLAFENGNPNAGNSSRVNNQERRGLGSGGDQILINGKRMAGKDNDGINQLNRIPASQVTRIEIIRGTSGDLDVRGGAQIINIVLVEGESRSSIAAEVNTGRYQDGNFETGGSISYSGQRGDLNYLVSFETEPQYEHRVGFESSINGDFSPNDTVNRVQTIDETTYTLNTNLAYDLGQNDRVHFNALYNESDPPQVAQRIVTNLNTNPNIITSRYDDIPSTATNWEIGGDYERNFENGSKYKILFISNRSNDETTRETYDVSGTTAEKELYLYNANTYTERIIRTSYSFGSGNSQAFEFGIERAQTILDSKLRLGLSNAPGMASANFGALVPVTDSNARVEEIRYETFAVHNWQINDRMSLESSLIYESSTIEQSGDVNNKRNFDFVRPRLDYRFDITPDIQVRATIDKDVSQLSFADFTANTNSADDDQNAIAGNPELVQEKSIRYELNLEYRLPGDGGVLNAKVFYHDLEDVIDKVDVSNSGSILSANGNIGDGIRYGLDLDASIRLGFLHLPELLVTSSLKVEDSEVTDPFLGIKRRIARSGRGEYRVGFRHDIPSQRLNYGLQYIHSIEDNRKVYDIDKIESFNQGDSLSIFIETVGFAGLTYRFESMNTLEGSRCRVRSRYTGGTIATGVLNEIEDSCSTTGIKYALKIRGTF